MELTRFTRHFAKLYRGEGSVRPYIVLSSTAVSNQRQVAFYSGDNWQCQGDFLVVTAGSGGAECFRHLVPGGQGLL